jgi:hypothetical protein
MNLKAYIRGRLVNMLTPERPDAADLYSPRREKEARGRLDALILELLQRYGLSLRLGRVLTHGE